MTSHLATITRSSTSTPKPGEQHDGFIGWVLSLISDLGEIGVGLALALETLFPPIPSELILPVAGYLSYSGEMNIALALTWATAGAMISAWIFYAVGALVGRDRTRWLFDKLPLFEVADFDRAERVFARWGGVAVLVGRCIPLVRSVISIPAGIERMPLTIFSLYTLAGSLVWNSIWIGLGYAFGPRIDPALARYSDLLSKLVLVGIAAVLAWFVVTRSIKLARGRATRGSARPDDDRGNDDRHRAEVDS